MSPPHHPRDADRRRSLAVLASTSGVCSLVLAGLAASRGAGGPELAWAAAMVSGSGIVLAGRSLPLPAQSRVYLASLVLGGGLLLLGSGTGVIAASIVILAVTVVLASAWEGSRRGAGLWTLAAMGSWVGGVWLGRAPAGTAADPVDGGLLIAAVPLGLVVLAALTHAMTQSLDETVQLSEVARRKLIRSNTELGKAVQRSEATLEKLATIVDHLGEGLVAISHEGLVELANPRVSTLLDVEPIQPGTPIEEAFPPELVQRFHDWRVTGEAATVELPLPGQRVGEATLSPIGDPGSEGGTVVLLRDVTLSRQIDRMKSDFAATVSHEMRTPLTSVLGFTKIVRGQLEKRILPSVPADDREAQRAAGKVLRNLDVVLEEGARLTTLINDVLDISKMESGQMVWDMQPHSPSAIVRRAFAATSALFAEDGPVTPVDAVPEGLPTVLVDHDRVLQVLINLIGNAAKFTDAGTITATAEVRGDFVALSIVDTGIGMRASDLDTVFEKFRQVGDVLTDRPQGTGLGLPICREIVEHHGGRIDATSRLGEGSVFTFTLPIAPETESTDS